MTDIINLRMARKARKRSADAQAAAQNRAHYGRTKGEKLSEARERARMASELDGARRESD